MIKLSRMPKVPPLRLRLALACAMAALAACSQESSSSNKTGALDNSLAEAPPPVTALPLATGPAPAYAPAPVASALPPAPSAPLGAVPPADQYAYLNQAYDFSQSLADAPPDYTYDYQGETPWVWQSPDGYYRVAERLPVGVRYFYYAPGGSEPYLVQDPQYSYGYSNGRLAVVYDVDGRVLPYDVQARQARAAGVYLAWAAGLYAASRHEAHVAVSQARWDAERQAVYADQARWTAAQRRSPAWVSYSQAHQNDQAHWADEHYARAAEAARFAQVVQDPTALARAQHAATDARAIAQSPRGRPPKPPEDGGLDRRGPSPTTVRAPELSHGEAARAQRQQPLQPKPPGSNAEGRDHAPAQPRPATEARRPAERPNAAPAPAQPGAHKPPTGPAPQRVSSERVPVQVYRPAPTPPAPPHIQAERPPPVVAARPASPPPHPVVSPAKPPAKPKPDDPHR